MSNKRLSVVLIIGDDRENDQAALDSLYRQTIADEIEIIIYDMALGNVPRLHTLERVATEYVDVPKETTWEQVRAQGVRRARAPVIAFIEDHCVAEADWARAIVRAHQGPWACVGYAFTNPAPENYLARSNFVAEYGRWMHPARRGSVSLLPSGNVAYKRDILLGLGDELEFLLTPDFVMHERLRQMGLQLYVEPDARISHASYYRLRDILQASFTFCRIMAARRVQTQGWSKWKRLGYAIATPIAAPFFSFARLAASLRGRRSLWGVALSSMPIILIRSVGVALGESLGYLFGVTAAGERMTTIELRKERNPAR